MSIRSDILGWLQAGNIGSVHEVGAAVGVSSRQAGKALRALGAEGCAISNPSPRPRGGRGSLPHVWAATGATKAVPAAPAVDDDDLRPLSPRSGDEIVSLAIASRPLLVLAWQGDAR